MSTPSTSAAATHLPPPGGTRHLETTVLGRRIFYRDSGTDDAPTLLLLHGFPSGSHQFRRMFDVLGARYRLVAPDYPGFGHSESPPPGVGAGRFEYTFDNVAAVVEAFVEQLGLAPFVMYVFDYGAPIGFRLAARHPDWVRGLVVQNGNIYEEGLSETAKVVTALRPGDPGADERIRQLLRPEITRSQYLTGAGDPTRISPDGWTLDQHFLDLPGRDDIQVALHLDYHSNLPHYPDWQAWLRRHRPPTLVTWGRGDPFFTEVGARAYVDDLPDAEVHLFDTGHFALEEALEPIAALIDRFLGRLGGLS